MEEVLNVSDHASTADSGRNRQTSAVRVSGIVVFTTVEDLPRKIGAESKVLQF